MLINVRCSVLLPQLCCYVTTVTEFYKAEQNFLFLWTAQTGDTAVIQINLNFVFYALRISILGNGNLRIWNATKSDAGLYTCVARNQFGVASSTGSITVKGISYSLCTFHHFFPFSFFLSFFILICFSVSKPLTINGQDMFYFSFWQYVELLDISFCFLKN